MKSAVLIVCVLIYVSIISEACKCFVRHPQNDFCQADYVIKAEVLGEENVTSFEKRYKVKVLENYKSGYTSPFKYSQVWIYTTTSSAACGVQLDIGKTYVITGPKRGTKLTANTCSWNVEVSALTSFQRNALRKGYYRKNCECKIRECPHNRCEQGDGCLAPYDNSFCFHQNAACKQSAYPTSCEWTPNTC
ncbi:metalloproteinase inhibitor 3-like [Crassostrea angulata]|uniref:metalloproteinase inhibitor 3-like n=1 Tax=Magallana angulata TaxID=2784310 RepID=UPI0022B1CE72|nr:metalloproteinase inhibitor 3-like [Crassostrea angulata]